MSAQCIARRSYRGNVDIGADLQCRNNAAPGSAYCRAHAAAAPPAARRVRVDQVCPDCDGSGDVECNHGGMACPACGGQGRR